MYCAKDLRRRQAIDWLEFWGSFPLLVVPDILRVGEEHPG